MATLLIRLAGPLQAWGDDSRFEVRKTRKEPTKSGVIGLLAAALGRKRNDPINDLAGLRMGIRVDQEGQLLRDFHMVAPKKNDNKRYKGTSPFELNPPLKEDRSKAWVTNRYYLSDAIFLVGLESDDTALLENLTHALRNPKYPLYLGRRACPPDFPLVLGVRETDLLSALQQEPWSVSDYAASKTQKNKGLVEPSLRILIDVPSDDANAYFQNDLPLSFDPHERMYGLRAVSEIGFILPQEQSNEHDAMEELR